MALIVEDGTIVADANSYIDVDYFRDYFNLRNETFDNSDTELESFIVRATQYIDNNFKYKGIVEDVEQDLTFPRINLYTRDGILVEGIPKKVKKAVCEATKLLVNGTDLFTSYESGAESKSVTVGPIKESYSYSNGTSSRTVYSIVKDYLYDYVKYTHYEARVVRS